MAGRMRGQPVLVLLTALCSWVGGRLSAWETQPLAVSPVHAAVAGRSEDGGYRLDPAAGPQSPARNAALFPPGAVWQGYSPDYLPDHGKSAYLPGPSASGLARERVTYVMVPYPAASRSGLLGPPPPARAAGLADIDDSDPGRDFPHALLGVLSRERLPSGLPSFQALRESARSLSAPEAGMDPRPRGTKRWSADSWALWRGDGPGPLANGALPATYGASQAGAVLRYRLAPRSAYRPDIYMRSTATLGQMQRETAAAIGLAARPLPRMPIVAALEGRLTEYAGKRRVQPVGMVITAIPPIDLAHGLRAETYAQAGYVGGAFATPFAEGQLRVDHELLHLGSVESRVGGGIWGGAQKGANRLDAGPSATFAMPLARGVFGRVGVDWRVRVAGDAEPGSGPALTLSAGF